MTKKEFLKLYEGNGVWCKTEELANEFLELAEGFGLKWASGHKLTENNKYNEYNEKTCYVISPSVCAVVYADNEWFMAHYVKMIEFKSLKTNSTPQVTFDPPKTILTLNGEEFVSIAKDKPFDKEKGVLMCLAKANGFDYDKVSELVENAKKQMPKLTDAERVILENLPKEWKWIIRNGNNMVHIYKEKSDAIMINYNPTVFNCLPFHNLFQFIKWSDEEPYEIEKLLEK